MPQSDAAPQEMALHMSQLHHQRKANRRHVEALFDSCRMGYLLFEPLLQPPVGKGIEVT